MSENNNKINRRSFLKSAGAVGATTLVAGCSDIVQPPVSSTCESSSITDGPAVLRKKRELKMVTTWPKDFPGMGVGAQRLAETITQMSGGLLDIKVYAANELVHPMASFDTVSQGKADIYHGAEYYWQGKSPAFNFFAAVPMGMTSTEMDAWIYHDGGQELWDELCAPFNIKPFMAGSTGTQMGGWFRKEINNLQDLQGLRMRMPGLGGEVIRRMGATPVTKAGNEIAMALSQGNIDATEWVGPWNDLAFNLHEYAKYYYYPGIHEPGTALGVGLNLHIWEDFNDWEKSIWRAACRAEHNYLYAEYNANNGRSLERLIRDHGVNLKVFSDDILEEMARVSIDVLDETAAADPFTQKVYDSFKDSMKRTSEWGDIADRAFVRARAFTKQYL